MKLKPLHCIFAACTDITPGTKDVGDGYAWYTVAKWVPAPDEFFWIAPGRFNEDGKSAINGVYVDKIKLELVDTP